MIHTYTYIQTRKYNKKKNLKIKKLGKQDRTLTLLNSQSPASEELSTTLFNTAKTMEINQIPTRENHFQRAIEQTDRINQNPKRNSQLETKNQRC